MVTNILILEPDDTVGEAKSRLAKKSWDDIHAVYIVDSEKHLVGQIWTTVLLTSMSTTELHELMVKPTIVVPHNAKRDALVREIIRKDAQVITVVDDDNRLLGVISDDQVVDILHSEHVEDFLRSSGFNETHHALADIVHMDWLDLVRSRIPWLLFGLMVGLIGSIITSRFEASLREHITLVFFLPIMTYMSDAIGTQTEAIFIRAVSLFKVKLTPYILREGLVGMTIGLILGMVAGVFAFLISGSVSIGIVISISLFLSMTSATILACVTPVVLTLVHKDEAVGSGPFTTALQDLLSITIYLAVATLILG